MPLAAASAPYNFISEGKEGRAALFCRLLDFRASRHQQAQGRPARASRPHFVPISIFMQHLELRGRMYPCVYVRANQCLVPSLQNQTPGAITEQTANGVLRTTNFFDWNTRQHAYTGYDRLSNEKTDRPIARFLFHRGIIGGSKSGGCHVYLLSLKSPILAGCNGEQHNYLIAFVYTSLILFRLLRLSRDLRINHTAASSLAFAYHPKTDRQPRRLRRDDVIRI